MTSFLLDIFHLIVVLVVLGLGALLIQDLKSSSIQKPTAIEKDDDILNKANLYNSYVVCRNCGSGVRLFFFTGIKKVDHLLPRCGNCKCQSLEAL